MARTPRPWWREDRQAWFVTVNGKRHNLGPDAQAAQRKFHKLMAEADTDPASARVSVDTVVSVLDCFLEWCQRHRAPRTYDWYRQRLQWFADAIPKNLSLDQFRPLHVQQWVDGHPNWSPGHTRGCIRAVQRAFRWAAKQGYLDRNPIPFIEKPQYGTRSQVISANEYRAMLSEVKDEEFRDLLQSAWETGARPQELIRVEARHVDLERFRWVFPGQESKVKSQPRIVYLTATAVEISRRNMAKHPEGPLFRNTRGRPWKPWAVNCRFNRLKQKTGTKYCLYAFRHTFATRLLQGGVDALTVAILLGHRDPSMLARVYQHLGHNPQHLLNQLGKAV